MIIPAGYAHVQHFFGGGALPNGAAVTYGTSGFGATNPTTMAGYLHDAFALHIMPLLSDNAQLLETRVKYGPNATGAFGSFQEVVTGGTAGETVAPNTAILVEKRTNLGGRAGRGRMYIPGAPETQVASTGKLTTGAVTAWETALDAWLDNIDTQAFGMWLFHSASSDPTAVTDLSVDPVAATQRRRLR